MSEDGVSVTTRGDLEDAADDTFKYSEVGVVSMKEYEAPVTYHGWSICDDEKMLSDEPVIYNDKKYLQ